MVSRAKATFIISAIGLFLAAMGFFGVPQYFAFGKTALIDYTFGVNGEEAPNYLTKPQYDAPYYQIAVYTFNRGEIDGDITVTVIIKGAKIVDINNVPHDNATFTITTKKNGQWWHSTLNILPDPGSGQITLDLNADGKFGSSQASPQSPLHLVYQPNVGGAWQLNTKGLG